MEKGRKVQGGLLNNGLMYVEIKDDEFLVEMGMKQAGRQVATKAAAKAAVAAATPAAATWGFLATAKQKRQMGITQPAPPPHR